MNPYLEALQTNQPIVTKTVSKPVVSSNPYLSALQTESGQPTQQTPFSTVHKLQGGGALNIGSSTSDLINTGHTTYAGTPTKKGYERADIVPVSLGGSNQTKENITYEPYSTVEKIKDKLAEIAGKNYVPQTATDKYLKNEILPQYKAGKITLNEARVKAVGFLSDQQQGLKKSTLANYPPAVKDTVTGVIKGLIEQYTKPSENIQKAEKLLGASAPKNKLEKVATAPIRTAEKIFIRTFGPMVDPLAQDIGEIVATREISNKVARGEMPASALDDINVLKKTFPQIVGDVSQTVLAAYIPNFAGEALGIQTTKNVASKFGPAFAGEIAGRTAGRTILEKVATGGVAGLKAGTLFGGAQVLSSGSKELKEISNIIGQNIIFGTLLGGVTSGLTGILGKVKEVKAQIKDPRMKDIWNEVENSVKERVNNPKIIEKEIDVKLDNQIKLLDAPQQNKMIGTTEPKLLEAPKKRAEIIGEGFVMTDKANKEKVALIKTINSYREELKSFIKNPTPTKRAKVEAAKTAMDEGIANWNKPPEKTLFQQIHEQVQSGKQVEAPKIEVPQETKAPLAQLHEQFQAEQAKTITPTEPLTKTQEPASVKKQAVEVPVTQKTVKSTPEPVKTQGEAISGQIKGTEKVSGVAKQIEAKAVEKGLIEKGYSELPEYDASTIKKQSELGSKFSVEQLEKMTKTGELPNGMKPATPLSILEDVYKNNPEKLIELAQSPLTAKISESASEISLSRMRDKESAVAQIKKVTDARKEKFKEQIKSEAKKIKEEIKKSKITKDVWASFVDEITC